MAPGLQAQLNPLASSETTVLKTRFGPGDGRDPLSRSIAFDATSTERSCCLARESVFHCDINELIAVDPDFNCERRTKG